MEKFLENKTRNIIIAIVAILAIFLFVHETEYRKPVNVIEQHIEDGNLIVTLDGQGSCYLGDEMNNDKSLWTKTDENNTVSIPITDYETNLYIRNAKDFNCGSVEDLKLSYIESVKITSGKVYLAVGGKEQLTYDTVVKGTIDDKVTLKSADESIATIDENNIIHGEGVGTTKITATYGDHSDSVEVIVTDLIVVAPREFDLEKPFLPCGIYSEEDNDLLDEILTSRVDKVGRATRAGVVEAARFLALEFPYRINYFLENGRLESHVNRFADGEGRYYHLGLYLHESRIANIDPDKIVGGPGCWGCVIREYSNSRSVANGLDCSGFVSWAVYNGGFDCHDMGAGIAHEWKDMSDLGVRKYLPDEVWNDRLRVGDLLAGGEGGPSDGGHIAIVAGIDKEGYIYVAEELNYSNWWGYFIKKYDKSSLLHYFYWRVDMEDYYVNGDGKLTDFWIEGE